MQIRFARAGEGECLTRLCFLSKAVWGYPADFLEKCRSELTIPESLIGREKIQVCEMDSIVAGVAGLEVQADRAEITHLFVHPGHFRQGAGTALFEAAQARAVELGARTLCVVSDPNAVGFYESVGMTGTGDWLSGVFPGRKLPRFEKTIAR